MTFHPLFATLYLLFEGVGPLKEECADRTRSRKLRENNPKPAELAIGGKNPQENRNEPLHCEHRCLRYTRPREFLVFQLFQAGNRYSLVGTERGIPSARLSRGCLSPLPRMAVAEEAARSGNLPRAVRLETNK